MSARANDLKIRNGTFELNNLSFDIPALGCAAITGSSGVGKTTLLEAICGLKPILSGELFIGETSVHDLPPWERGIGYVPQEVTLFHHMTVKQHLEFAPRIRKWSREKRELQVARTLELIELESLQQRYPNELSGGQGQRLAIGRAVSFQPQLLCLDEPFAWLDRDAAAKIGKLILLLAKEFSMTTILVSHRSDDVETLANTVFAFRDGQLVEVT